VRTQHALIAVELDGRAQSTQHVPTHWIPWSEGCRNYAECKQRGISGTTMLMFMRDHELSVCGIQCNHPLRENDFWVKNADNQRTGIQGNQNGNRANTRNIGAMPHQAEPHCGASKDAQC